MGTERDLRTVGATEPTATIDRRERRSQQAAKRQCRFVAHDAPRGAVGMDAEEGKKARQIEVLDAIVTFCWDALATMDEQSMPFSLLREKLEAAANLATVARQALMIVKTAE